MHPTFKQVPPSVLYFSMMAVFNPNCAQRIAATYPPGPEPIITTSYIMSILDYKITTSNLKCSKNLLELSNRIGFFLF